MDENDTWSDMKTGWSRITGENPDRTALSKACARWQSGRDDGSSLLRGAARVLTDVPHYFDAEFIREIDKRAKHDPTALDDGEVLLSALRNAPVQDAADWSSRLGLHHRVAFAGRGLAPKPQDAQICRRLASGDIDMPLWGVSLDRQTADKYGTKFLLELAGPFPAVAAWSHSGIKAEEEELITGGHYRVRSVDLEGSTVHAVLVWQSPLPVVRSNVRDDSDQG